MTFQSYATLINGLLFYIWLLSGKLTQNNNFNLITDGYNQDFITKHTHTNTNTPDNLNPNIKLAWFFSSLRTKQPGPTRLGMLRELVANPMPKTMASSTPRNLAVVSSNSSCKGVVPYSRTGEQSDVP